MATIISINRIFNRSYQFHADESVASVILADDGVNYADFNALPLDEALQVVLTNNDGCFVCFGGNTMLIGSTEGGFFTFDSHSRCSDGMLSVSGRSTRILLQNVNEVYSHLQGLALSMGYSKGVECNLSGVSCKISCIADVNDLIDHEEDISNVSESSRFSAETIDETCNRIDDLIFVCQEQLQFSFIPLSTAMKKQLCQMLDIPFICVENSDNNQCTRTHIREPVSEKEILGDGNCFFRDVSFSLTNSEEFHNELRSAVCDHMMGNQELFKQFLKDGTQSVESHLASTGMSKEGSWATEVEIFAAVHLLNVDIYTYSEGHWLRFLVAEVDPCIQTKNGAIYLNHHHQNHYNVVLSVNGEELDVTPVRQCKNRHEYDKRIRNRTRMQNKRHCTIELQQESSAATKRTESLRKKYQDNADFREKKLKAAFLRYADDEEFQTNVKRVSKERYYTDMEYRNKSKMRSKKRSLDRYTTDGDHRDKVRKRSIEKYATDEQHREAAKKRSVQRYATDYEHKEKVKKKSIQKYAIDEKHRILVNTASTNRYRENENFRERKLCNAARNYKNDESLRSKIKYSSKKQYHLNAKTKMKKKENVKSRRIAQRVRFENQEEVVRGFKGKVLQGIDYSCCCCDRLLFQNQVQRCERETYAKSERASNVADLCIQEKYCHQCSESCPQNCTRSNLWICYTCHRKILRGILPAEAAANKMTLEDIPKELKELNSLEKHLIAIHIPFMKVMALPNGGQRNIHGPVVCVPSDLKKVTSLPMKPGEDLLLRVKLKRKLNYKGYIEYQFVDPKHIFEALEYLKLNNQWYKDVAINTNWKGSLDEDQEISESSEVLSEEDDNHHIITDTCLQPVDIALEVLDHYFDDIFDIAPGEGNNPVRMLQEEGNEAKTFPYLFPSGHFSWNDSRETRITLSRYFNNRLMNTDDRFARDSSYIFFSQFMSDLNQVIEQTQISIRKSVKRIGCEQLVTANMVQNPEILSKLMKNDEALRFMQPIRGTPAYWSAAQKDLFAMLRQLGIPTWFCSFSAAEHRWNDAVATILRQQNDNRDPSLLDWSEKNEVLRSNPVTVARMFEHRFHVFQTEVILSPSEPIGKVLDYFQRVEFQQRGSPHMHCLYWIENAPKLDEDGEDAVCSFINKYVSCAVPCHNEDMELRDIVFFCTTTQQKTFEVMQKEGD